MDRQSIIGIVLISLVVGIWVFLQQPAKPPVAQPKGKAPTAQTTTAVDGGEQSPVQFMPAPVRMLTVVTPLYTIRLSSFGATVRSWKLMQYKPWYRLTNPAAVVDVVQPGAHEFGFWFIAKNDTIGSGGILDTVKAKDVPFTFDVASELIDVKPGDSVTITATAKTDFGGTIVRTYRFAADHYDVVAGLQMAGFESVLHKRAQQVHLEWRGGIRYQEQSSVDESNNAVGIISEAGNITEFEAESFTDTRRDTSKGSVDFVATRSKYFAVAMLPEAGFSGKATVNGIKVGLPQEGIMERYGLALQVPLKQGAGGVTSRLYVGPMQYDTLGTYGLTGIMNFGWKWIVKPIGEYFMLPTLKLIHLGIPNYGIAILLFALLMKAILYPLSIGQMESAKKMQLVAPLVSQVRERFPDDMTRQQQETMKIYSEYGINPAGGCLPLVLQMPFLYALYSVLNLNIDLRQQGFLPVWITDLSVPDVILSLPFKLPLFNVDHFSGLALLMGATMFIQQKQALTDPRQKAMVYMMPIMLTLMFSSLPSGLNLYYFVFNVVAIGQTIWQKKFSKNQLTLADLKKMPKKESWMQKKMREAQEMAAAQGRSLPGQSHQDVRKPRSGKGKK
ncbi:MAG: membrane protein insertase YidC [Candidatus Kapaibacterium sp.]